MPCLLASGCGMEKTYNKNFMKHGMIMQGGKLELWLTDKATD